MRLQQILDDMLDLLEAEDEGRHFKSIGALRKSEYQHEKYESNEDEAFIRSDMYKGTVGNSEAAKKGSETRKKCKNLDEINKRAAETRANWYKNPENRKKFEAACKKRDKKKLKKQREEEARLKKEQASNNKK